MKNEDGFTLVEVIASIILISIILLSFVPYFINTNKTSERNLEKLVVIYLADAQLLRLQQDPFEVLDKPTGNLFTKDYQTPSQPKVNGREYKVAIRASQKHKDEITAKIINVKVTVTAPNGTTKTTVEGYVPYE